MGKKRTKEQFVEDSLDPILSELKWQKRPIIFHFGIPARMITQTRKKCARQLAKSLGFKYIDLDEQVSKWIENYKDMVKFRLVEQDDDFRDISDLDPITVNKVTVEVTPKMDFVIFQLNNLQVSLKIVPTRSRKLSPSMEDLDLDEGSISADALEALRPFHIVEELNRNKILELFKFALYENLPASGFIIDGFPKDKTDVLNFERMFYKAKGAINWTVGLKTLKERIESYPPNFNRALASKKEWKEEMEKRDSNHTKDSYTCENHGTIVDNPLEEKPPVLTGNRGTRSTPSKSTPTSKSKSREDEQRNHSAELKMKIKEKIKVKIGTLQMNYDNYYNFHKTSREPWIGFYGQDYRDYRKPAVHPRPGIYFKDNNSDSTKLQPKRKQFIQYPKYIMRPGQYTADEIEQILIHYGNKAIQLNDTELLRLHPDLLNTLTISLKDSLTILINRTSKISKKNSINFCLNEFSYKPMYPGPKSTFLKTARTACLLNPLQIHHENDKCRLVISIQDLVDNLDYLNTAFMPIGQISVNKNDQCPPVCPGKKILRGKRLLNKNKDRTLRTSAADQKDGNLVDIGFPLKVGSSSSTISEEDDIAEESGKKRNPATAATNNEDGAVTDCDLLLEENTSDLFLYNSNTSILIGEQKIVEKVTEEEPEPDIRNVNTVESSTDLFEKWSSIFIKTEKATEDKNNNILMENAEYPEAEDVLLLFSQKLKEETAAPPAEVNENDVFKNSHIYDHERKSMIEDVVKIINSGIVKEGNLETGCECLLHKIEERLESHEELNSEKVQRCNSDENINIQILKNRFHCENTRKKFCSEGCSENKLSNDNNNSKGDPRVHDWAFPYYTKLNRNCTLESQRNRFRYSTFSAEYGHDDHFTGNNGLGSIQSISVGDTHYASTVRLEYFQNHRSYNKLSCMQRFWMCLCCRKKYNRVNCRNNY